MPRHYCENCQKAEPACICKWLKPQTNTFPVLILQHKDEYRKPLGTAKLADISLKNTKILTGNELSRDLIMDALEEMGAQRPALLYPQSFQESPRHIEVDFEKDNCKRSHLLSMFDSVILLDGTWRNTRELILVNHWLKSLQTVALKNVESSRYRIRKAPDKGSIATIEAIAQLLAIMNPELSSSDLLLPFEKMIEYQISRMGYEVYAKNYGES